MTKAVEEAATIKFGPQLRRCFVTLLIHAMPANFFKPSQLHCVRTLVNKVLLQLQAMFDEAGKDMVKDFNLPQPSQPIDLFSENPVEVQQELQYSQEELARETNQKQS